jgi:hypothetical protein
MKLTITKVLQTSLFVSFVLMRSLDYLWTSCCNHILFERNPIVFQYGASIMIPLNMGYIAVVSASVRYGAIVNKRIPWLVLVGVNLFSFYIIYGNYRATGVI